MTFQAYIDNIKEKTGKSPEDFNAIAKKKGLLKPDVKAGEIVAWEGAGPADDRATQSHPHHEGRGPG